MGKGFGIILMILGVIAFFFGTTFLPQYPTISDSAMQIIAIIVFVIGALVTFFSGPKYPQYPLR